MEEVGLGVDGTLATVAALIQEQEEVSSWGSAEVQMWGSVVEHCRESVEDHA